MKIQLPKIGQSVGFLCTLISKYAGSLMRAVVLLAK